MDKWQWGGGGLAVIGMALPMTGLVSHGTGWAGVGIGVLMIVAPFAYNKIVGDDETVLRSEHDLRAKPARSGGFQVSRGNDGFPDSGAQGLVVQFHNIFKDINFKPEKTIETHRAEWARLRAAGVEMRNAGHHGFFQDVDWQAWEASVINWNSAVIAAIKPVDEAEALWFATLDTVPPPRIPMDSIFATDHYMHIYAMHDFRLVKLEHLIQQYRNKNTAIWGP